MIRIEILCMVGDPMKKSIIFIVSILLLAGCSNVQVPNDHSAQQLNTSRRFEMSPPIFETDSQIYYADQTGIIAENKADLSNKTMQTESRVLALYVCDDDIFYSTDQDAIYRMKTDGTESALVWNKSQIADTDYDFLGIHDFAVYKNKLYIQNTGTSMLSYDMGLQTTEQFIDDISDGVFMDDYFYYTDHAERTFSIYKIHLDSKERELVRGDGMTYDESKTDLYDRLIVVNDTLYYTKRYPAQLYRYNEDGGDQRIADLSVQDIIYLAANGNDLYFAVRDGAAGQLYRHTVGTNKYENVATVDDFYPNLTFDIVDNQLFYFDQDQMLHIKEI